MTSFVINFFETILPEQKESKFEVKLFYANPKSPQLRVITENDKSILHNLNDEIAKLTTFRNNIRGSVVWGHKKLNELNNKHLLDIDADVITKACQQLKLNFTFKELKKELELKGAAPQIRKYAVNQCKFEIDFSKEVKEEFTVEQFRYAYLERYRKAVVKDRKSYMLNHFGLYKTVDSIKQYVKDHPGSRSEKTVKQLTFRN